jgi:hypothetical protein
LLLNNQVIHAGSKLYENYDRRKISGLGSKQLIIWPAFSGINFILSLGVNEFALWVTPSQKWVPTLARWAEVWVND